MKWNNVKQRAKKSHKYQRIEQPYEVTSANGLTGMYVDAIDIYIQRN